MSNENNTALATLEPNPLEVSQFSAFGSIIHFESAQRMGKMLSCSSIVPETYRGPDRIGDCVIALEIANRIGASVLAVMQNLYIVYGRPAWSSQFLISCVNASRKFTPLRYRMTGNKTDDTWGCVAWATDRSGEKLESPEVTIAMAKAEGWYQKNGSKWKTMPELMLRYRTATLFARLFAPELTMGIQSDEEIIDITPVVTDSTRAPKGPEALPSFAPLQLQSAEPTPAKTEAKEALPAASRKPDPAPQPELKAQPELKVVKEPTVEERAQNSYNSTPQGSLELFMTDAEVSFENFRRWAIETERLNDGDSFSSWSELPADFCAALQKDGKAVNRCITRCKTYGDQ